MQSVLIVEKDPHKFLKLFWECAENKTPLFIGNPNWKEADWKYLRTILNPDRILGNCAPFIPWDSEKKTFKLGSIFIPTGGTTGKIRFVQHTIETLTCPTESILSFFNIRKIHSFCILPLYHISGLIQAIRTKSSGGNLYIGDWKELENGTFPQENLSGYHLSMVPTQLQRLLQNKHAIDWLKKFSAIFLGGAPASKLLLDKARDLKLNIAPTYGLTETAAMATVMHPKYFLSNKPGAGKPLKHIQIKIESDRKIWIQSHSLFKGYFPEKDFTHKNGYFCTSDLGNLSSEGFLYNISRGDRVIITGGEKVDPVEIETFITETGYVSDVLLFGKSHQEWGEEVCAIYTTKDKKPLDADILKSKLKDKFEGYKIPKQWIWVKAIPFDEKGKLSCHQLKELAGT